MEKLLFKRGDIVYDIRIIERGVLIVFSKSGADYEIKIVNVKKGHTEMTDYYKYGSVLTHDEFVELEKIINLFEDGVSKIE